MERHATHILTVYKVGLGRTFVRSNISKVVRLCVAEKRGVIYVSAGLMVDCLASHIFFTNSIKKHVSHIFSNSNKKASHIFSQFQWKSLLHTIYKMFTFLFHNNCLAPYTYICMHRKFHLFWFHDTVLLYLLYFGFSFGVIWGSRWWCWPWSLIFMVMVIWHSALCCSYL